LNVLKQGFEVGEVLDAAGAGEITVLPLVPTMITMLLEELERRGEPQGGIGSLMLVPYAGSAIQPDRAAAAAAYFGETMHQVYGASEVMLPTTSLPPTDHVATTNERGLPRLASAGKPTHLVEVRVVDEDRKELPQGEIGEIKVFGEHTASGYWQKPQETKEAFDDGWVYTGDVGFIDEFGYLFILDRRKDMIVSGGFNVYPREVENVISSLPGVREVAVVGAPDKRWGELITAVVSKVPGAELSADDVIARCRESIGGYKVPKRVVFVEDLPKNATGKIQKLELREELWADEVRRV
jgi:acyl-CoA synthetase (AMP-forming)/AMP-acid ligase II